MDFLRSLFRPTLLIAGAAFIIYGGLSLYGDWSNLKRNVSDVQTKFDTCDTERAKQTATAEDLFQKLDAKTKAYDNKRQRSCYASDIQDAERKKKVLDAHKAETELLDAHVQAVLKMVEDADALSGFPTVATVDTEFDGYGEYPVSQDVTPEYFRDHCGETCDDADFSARNETVRLFIPMRLAFWALTALDAFNALDFSDKENPPSQHAFIAMGYDGPDHQVYGGKEDPLRAKLLKVLEDLELVQQYGNWFVGFVKTAKPFTPSAGRGAKLWLADAWTASWAPFEKIEKELKENEQLLAIGYTDSGYTAFDGWFYRRWENTGGKSGGKDGKDGMVLITEYRRFLIALASAIGMPSYADTWQKQLDSGKGPPREEEKEEAGEEEGGDEEEEATDTEAGDASDGDGDEAKPE